MSRLRALQSRVRQDPVRFNAALTVDSEYQVGYVVVSEGFIGRARDPAFPVIQRRHVVGYLRERR